MERDLEFINVLRASPLNIGARTVFGREFPLGSGYYVMKLRIGIILVVGTGTTPVVEGELLFIKNIFLRTDAGEILCNLPGRAIYQIAKNKKGTAPRKDAIAAANGTYYVDLAIYFSDDAMLVPEDTILDTARYNLLSLDVQLGTVADLLGVVGTSSVTGTLDCEITQTKGILPDEAKPLFVINYDVAQPQDASQATLINLEKTVDLAYKRLYIHASSGSAAGVSFGGQNADDVQFLESISDQAGFIVQERIHEMIQNQNKEDYMMEVISPGITIVDFVRDGSINTALWSGNKSKLDYKWTNKAGVAAGDIVSLAYEGIRALK